MLQSSSPLGLGYLGPEDGCAQALLLVPHGTKHRRRRFGSAAIRKSTGKENGKSNSFSSLALCLVGASHVPKQCPLGRQRGDKPQICSTQTLIVDRGCKAHGVHGSHCPSTTQLLSPPAPPRALHARQELLCKQDRAVLVSPAVNITTGWDLPKGKPLAPPGRNGIYQHWKRFLHGFVNGEIEGCT